MGDLETSQKPIVPSGKIYIRVGYKGSGESIGRKGIGVSLGGIRHTMDRWSGLSAESVLGDQSFKGKPLTKI